MKKAFTLVELIIVFVIMTLLAAIAIPAFHKVKEDSQKQKYRLKSNREQSQPESRPPAEEIIINGHKYRLVK